MFIDSRIHYSWLCICSLLILAIWLGRAHSGELDHMLSWLHFSGTRIRIRILRCIKPVTDADASGILGSVESCVRVDKVHCRSSVDERRRLRSTILWVASCCARCWRYLVSCWHGAQPLVDRQLVSTSWDFSCGRYDPIHPSAS